MSTRTWHRVALAHAGSRPQLVLASGEHVGQALAEAQHAVPGSHPIAVDVATADEIPLGESVGKGHIVQLGDAPALVDFRWPLGVLPTISNNAAVAGVQRGWIEHAGESLHVVEAQTDADHLVDLFLGLIERIPAADNLEVRVLDHFEHGATDIWLTSRTNARKILRFLDDHDDELIHNGHVELSVYLRAQKATLRLTQHKTVAWLADDRELAGDVERWLRELSVPHLAEPLVTVEAGTHVHFRLAKSRDRKRLGDELYKQRLRKVDTVKLVEPAD